MLSGKADVYPQSSASLGSFAHLSRYSGKRQSPVLLLRRSLLTQEGICLMLEPDFRFLEVAYPYVAKRLLTDEDPALRQRLIEVSLKLCRVLW